MSTETLTDQTETAHPRHRLAIGVGGLAVLLAAMDAYVVVGLFEPILNSLGIPLNHLERATPIVTGYLLGYVAGMPLLARVSDRYGRRIVLYLSLAGFAAGSAITAWSHSTDILVAGRALQGLAGGALLPVTMALAADLFAEARRPAVLGGVGAAQELGAVLGPLYGIAIGAWLGWRGVFWINIPLALLAALAVHRAVPRARRGDGPRPRVDVVGGLLLAGVLGLIVVALDNQHPENGVLAPWAPKALLAAAIVLVLFVIWEWRARTPLMDLAGVRRGVFTAAMVTSLLSGVALLATLVFIQVEGQVVLLRSASHATLLLARFLVALPVGALLGGPLVRWLGVRATGVLGMLVAAGAYVLIAYWPPHVLAAAYRFGPVHLPRFDTDLALAGFGLGLAIAPLSVAVLRAVPEAAHGIASAALVVARMMGMLIGVSALAAWGLNLFNRRTAHLNTPLPLNGITTAYLQQIAAYKAKVIDVYRAEFHSIFLITAVLCGAAAVLMLALGSRRTAASEPEA